MKIKIKRFDKSIPMPEYKTKGAAGIDLYSREDVTVESKGIGYIPLNVAIEIPKNYWIILAARSSTHKLGLVPANGIGIIDSDFSGNEDEYKFIVYNISDKDVTIPKSTRIAQIIVMEYKKVEIEEVDILKGKNRGGLGTTGVN
ncbi:dUTPase [candidate division WWE3 bacterium CG10_big_fil_rev_8_21_14_0_10_32_10]|uniref:dUTP diphosphatase n=1 Tax=candidate division WWE3 bacterium CG10_big_fil_rev_8_21_14_0_10_32_10 TaxID=1975090 RepID=A0A2H0RA17_UNCKA|nr:MAG: dUTPase [candidate division WWE3 bacterium CG10_big_fil_rev_8_21_14_0_10_32_10]